MFLNIDSPVALMTAPAADPALSGLLALASVSPCGLLDAVCHLSYQSVCGAVEASTDVRSDTDPVPV